MADSWSDRRPAQRRGPDPLEQRLDRLVSAGRQLVDGVSGARPGARSPGRPGLPRLDGLGRWVEGKLDWILEDGEELREPWQDPQPAGRRRRPLQAISRRTGAPRQTGGADPDVWPEDTDFAVPRWQRPADAPSFSPSPTPTPTPSPSPSPGRAVPRSSRRRPGASSSWSD